MAVFTHALNSILSSNAAPKDTALQAPMSIQNRIHISVYSIPTTFNEPPP